MKIIQIGNVLELFTSTEESSLRSAQTQLSLDEKGILNDKFYAKECSRSILITSLDSYILAQNNNITISYGMLGENILIDYNPYHLAAGVKLQIGNVILEITQNCTICNHLSSIDKKLPKLLKNDRGVFAKVVEGGFIQKSDIVYLLSN